MDLIKSLFSKTGIFIMIYVLIGVFTNTASPHLPSAQPTATSLHSWAQYIISILLWPLSFWHPAFTVGQWH